MCTHCRDQVCTKHFIEHVKQANAQLTPLADELNVLFDGIQTQDPTRRAFNQLERWRQASHRRIEAYYEEKKKQLRLDFDGKIERQNTAIRALNDDVKELLNEGDASCKQIDQISRRIKECRRQYQLIENTDFYCPKLTIPGSASHWAENRLFRGAGTLLNDVQQLDLNEMIGVPGQIWTLIYKATRDGFGAGDFHRCCDGMGATLTVIQSKDSGCLFGGYTSVSWHSMGNFTCDRNNPFLFTLTNPYGIPPTKYPVTRANYSIFCNGNYGPTFGGGHDLHVETCSNKTQASTITFPHSYEDTTGKGAATFTGSDHFQTSEIEVYQLVTP